MKWFKCRKFIFYVQYQMLQKGETVVLIRILWFLYMWNAYFSSKMEMQTTLMIYTYYMSMYVDPSGCLLNCRIKGLLRKESKKKEK